MNEMADHELFQLPLSQDADAWRFVWEREVLAECAVHRNVELVRKWGIVPEEIMSVLYFTVNPKVNAEVGKNGMVFR